jgi:hypothetical protein
MKERNEFWQRRVNDTLRVELVPGEQPAVLVEREDEGRLRVELSELKALIQVLTEALGELYILKDSSTWVEVERLLAKDVTLVAEDGEALSAAAMVGVRRHVRGWALVRRYRQGERRFAGMDLRGANLRGVDLRQIDLSGADLSGANLAGADLEQANLAQANLFQANLRGANLLEANLQGADLGKAELKCARVTAEQLAQAKSLAGATMPRGMG